MFRIDGLFRWCNVTEESAMSKKNRNLPEPSKVYNYIFHGNGEGEMQLSKLVKHPSPLQNFTEESALKWLKDYNRNISQLKVGNKKMSEQPFIIEENNGNTTVRLLNMRLCPAYGNGSCKYKANCVFWHVCKGFLEGNCVDAKQCALSHDFLDKHNRKKARKLGISDLSSSSILKMVVENLPVLCERYLKNECKDGNSCCQNVHLCPRYVKNVFKKAKSCKLSHNLHSSYNQKVFRNFGLPVGEYLFYQILQPKHAENKKASEVVPARHDPKPAVYASTDLTKYSNDTLPVSDYVVESESDEFTTNQPKVQIENKNINEVIETSQHEEPTANDMTYSHMTAGSHSSRSHPDIASFSEESQGNHTSEKETGTLHPRNEKDSPTTSQEILSSNDLSTAMDEMDTSYSMTATSETPPIKLNLPLSARGVIEHVQPAADDINGQSYQLSQCVSELFSCACRLFLVIIWGVLVIFLRVLEFCQALAVLVVPLVHQLKRLVEQRILSQNI